MENTPDVPLSEVEAKVEQPGNAPISVSPRYDIPAWKWILICVTLYLGALLYGMYSSGKTQRSHPAELAKGLDTTIAADVQAQVYEDLGHIENLQWVGLGFPMASAATILIYTRAYGLFNVKVLIVWSVFVFEVGSALCGAAPSSSSLIVVE
jgi:MFS family permease